MYMVGILGQSVGLPVGKSTINVPIYEKYECIGVGGNDSTTIYSMR